MPIPDARPLIEWGDPLRELFGFLALFLAAGAVGFRYSALRGRVSGDATPTGEALVYGVAARRAAVLGLAGSLCALWPLWTRLSGAAARGHMTVAQLATSDVGSGAAIVLAVLAVLGFAVATTGRQAGWPAAAAGVVLGALPDLFTLRWSRLVNPVHALAAGLWIGSLFVMVVAGILVVLRDTRVSDRRGTMVAAMVHAFSPMALTMGGVVVLFGLITAWRHLTPLSSLWTTPYGYALLTKLLFVAVVFGLGAWNWRRQRPTLGSDAAAVSIRRSSTMELCAAAVVLMITAVLVSLPSPRPPGPPPTASPAGSRG